MKFQKLLTYAFLCALGLLFCINIVQGQDTSPEIIWDELFGGNRAEQLLDIIPDIEAGITGVGWTKSKTEGGMDIFFLKTNTKGEVIKSHPIGRRYDDVGHTLIQTWDGGYLIGGSTASPAVGYSGGTDGWIIKTDKNGKAVWDKLYGTKKDEVFKSVLQAPDGGYYLVGNKGVYTWVIKIDQFGKIEWEEEYLAEGLKTTVNKAILDKQGNILITGYCDEKEDRQLFLMNIRSSGIQALGKVYPQEVGMEGTALLETSTGDLIITGAVKTKKYREDILFLKTNKGGEVIGTPTSFGEREMDKGMTLLARYDGSYWLIGQGRLKTGNRTDDIIILQVDDKGKMLWERPFEYGNKRDDYPAKAILMPKRNIVIAGSEVNKMTKQGDARLLNIAKEKLADVGGIPTIEYENLGFQYINTMGFLAKEQRAYQLLRLENTGTQNVYDIQATVACPTCVQGMDYFKRLSFGELRVGESRLVGIPVRAKKNLRNGTSTFNVTFNTAQNAVLPPLSFDVISKREATPELVITDSKFIVEGGGIADREKNITLRVVLKNEGDRKAENLRLKFGFPYKVEGLSQKEVELEQLDAGASNSVTFDFKVSSVYLDNQLILSLRVQEKEEKYGLSEEFTLQLQEYEESDVVNEVVKVEPEAPKDFVRIEWRDPDPDDYENYEILTDVGKANIQLKAYSTQELNQGHFSIFVNDKKYNKGQKFGKVKLTASKNIDRGSNRPVYRYTMTTEGIPLAVGDNNIYVKVTNAAGEANSGKLNFNYSGVKPNLFIFSVGVPQVDLLYTTKDAADFANIFASQEGYDKLFNKVHIDVYNDVNKTTKSSIMRKLRVMQLDNTNEKISDKDVVILFISSHGFIDEGNRYRIQTYDFDPLYPEGTTIDFQKELLKEFRQLDCTKFVFIDACRNKGDTEVDGGSRKGLSNKPAINAAIIKLLNDNGDIKTMLSCSEGEYSYEHKDWHNGAFTKCILDSTKKQQKAIVDKDQNEILSMAELYSYVKVQVPVLVSKSFTNEDKQNPHVPEEQVDIDLPIYVYPQ